MRITLATEVVGVRIMSTQNQLGMILSNEGISVAVFSLRFSGLGIADGSVMARGCTKGLSELRSVEGL